jgi:hypothetical protein
MIKILYKTISISPSMLLYSSLFAAFLLSLSAVAWQHETNLSTAKALSAGCAKAVGLL